MIENDIKNDIFKLYNSFNESCNMNIIIYIEFFRHEN